MNENDSSTPADELRQLEARINAILPPRYAGRLEEVAPTSMGSASLRYDKQGRVAWGEIWTTFCHLALAGGPPHRGRLLGPVGTAEVEAAPVAQQEVVAELERAIRLTIALPLSAEHRPGWIGIDCDDGAMASWLTRAITAENVSARREREVLFVPAGPHFRVEKEIKNVVVSLAKSCHYLLDHVELDQRQTGPGSMLIGPPLPEEIERSREAYDRAVAELRQVLQRQTPLSTSSDEYPGWLGLEYSTDEMAVWMLRAVAVEDVLVRREENRLFVPVSLENSAAMAGNRIADAVSRAYRLWRLKSGAS